MTVVIVALGLWCIFSAILYIACVILGKKSEGPQGVLFSENQIGESVDPFEVSDE